MQDSNDPSNTGSEPKRRPDRKPEGVYLWLNCEGWKLFGPHEWISLQDDFRAFVDQNGSILSYFDAESSCWRTPEPDSMPWSNPTITRTSRHPYAMQGSHPESREVRKQAEQLGLLDSREKRHF